MNIIFSLLLIIIGALPGTLFAQQKPKYLNWQHIYTKNGREFMITEFHAPADSVRLKYQCWPNGGNYLELRSRSLKNGAVRDTSYMSCPDSVKITAQTSDSTYIGFVPEKMLRRITQKEHPSWFASH